MKIKVTKRRHESRKKVRLRTIAHTEHPWIANSLSTRSDHLNRGALCSSATSRVTSVGASSVCFSPTLGSMLNLLERMSACMGIAIGIDVIIGIGISIGEGMDAATAVPTDRRLTWFLSTSQKHPCHDWEGLFSNEDVHHSWAAGTGRIQPWKQWDKWEVR